MLWFSVWLVLVLTTLAGAFFLGRRLWRAGTMLLAEVGRLSAVAQRLDALQVELAERFPAPAPPRSALAADHVERARLRDVRAAHREAVTHRRTRRLDRAMRHWDSLVRPGRVPGHPIAGPGQVD